MRPAPSTVNEQPLSGVASGLVSAISATSFRFCLGSPSIWTRRGQALGQTQQAGSCTAPPRPGHPYVCLGCTQPLSSLPLLCGVKSLPCMALGGQRQTGMEIIAFPLLAARQAQLLSGVPCLGRAAGNSPLPALGAETASASPPALPCMPPSHPLDRAPGCSVTWREILGHRHLSLGAQTLLGSHGCFWRVPGRQEGGSWET